MHIDTNEIATISLFHHCQQSPLYASQGGSCFVKPFAVLHLTVTAQWTTVLCMFIAPAAATTIGPGCPEVI